MLVLDKIFLHLPRFAFPWQGNAYSLPGFLPVSHSFRTLLLLELPFPELFPSAPNLRFALPSLVPAGVFSSPPRWLCLLFMPHLRRRRVSPGSAALCVQVTQKYSRTLRRGQDLSSSGSQSSPSAPLNLKRSIQ